MDIQFHYSMKYFTLFALLALLALSELITIDSQVDVETPSLSIKTNFKVTFKRFPTERRRLWDIICPRFQVNIDVIYKKPLGEGLDSVRQCIYPWFVSPIGQDLLQYEKKTLTKKFIQDGKTCTYSQFQSSLPSNQIFNYNQSPNVIFPGGFVQGQNIKTGSELYKSIPFGSSQRKKIGIYSPGQKPIQSDPTATSIHLTIRKYLSKITLGNDVYVQFTKSDDMNQVFSQLNFNQKIIQKLGIAALPGDVKKRKNKIFVFIAQGVAQIHPVIQSSNGPSDAIGAFLRPEIGQKECLEFQKYGWWGPYNLPCYIEKVSYGRFIAVSVDETPRTLQLYNKVKEGWGSDQELRENINQIFKDVSVKVFSIGSDKQCSLSKIKNREWEDCFGDVQNGDKSTLKPITFEMRDFKENQVKVSNLFKYYKRQCQE